MARKIARDVVAMDWAARCEVQLAYAIGVPDPVSVAVDCFGTETRAPQDIVQFIRESYSLTPRGIIDTLGLLDFDYNLTSAYGHFGRDGLPWE